jgi:hypothetical protein
MAELHTVFEYPLWRTAAKVVVGVGAAVYILRVLGLPTTTGSEPSRFILMAVALWCFAIPFLALAAPRRITVDASTVRLEYLARGRRTWQLSDLECREPDKYMRWTGSVPVRLKSGRVAFRIAVDFPDWRSLLALLARCDREP